MITALLSTIVMSIFNSPVSEFSNVVICVIGDILLFAWLTRK